MSIENLDFSVIIAFTILVFGINYFVYRSKKNADMEKEEKTAPLKIVKLYSGDGVLIKSFDGVYIKRWDTKIYNLYTKKGGEHIIKLEIGENMLLTSENVKEEV